ncbi:MAG: TVP38/TMEM64 family protein [Bacilli bacterium]|jgi:uncharacterized membrane protein YdjX (TVP38/TMEM64 family)
MSKKTSIVLFAIAFTTLLIILGVTIYELRPVFNSLINDPKHLDQAIDQYMENIGIYRAIILVILQIVTVILAVLPAEPVQMVAGISYGMLYGPIICLIGVFIANTIIYLMFKKLGNGVIDCVPFYAKWEEKVLLKKSHSNRIIDILILYFVPVFPYGLIAYIASRSKLRFIPYSLITTLGALPSIILSTSLTGSILSGNLILTVVLVGVAIVGISGMIVFRIIYVRKSKKRLTE